MWYKKINSILVSAIDESVDPSETETIKEYPQGYYTNIQFKVTAAKKLFWYKNNFTPFVYNDIVQPSMQQAEWTIDLTKFDFYKELTVDDIYIELPTNSYCWAGESADSDGQFVYEYDSLTGIFKIKYNVIQSYASDIGLNLVAATQNYRLVFNPAGVYQVTPTFADMDSYSRPYGLKFDLSTVCENYAELTVDDVMVQYGYFSNAGGRDSSGASTHFNEVVRTYDSDTGILYYKYKWLLAHSNNNFLKDHQWTIVTSK